MSSINDKLNKVRKPRIHIKYDVETESGAVQKELPFVVGVMGDFSGNNPDKDITPLEERKFIKIDPDNFDEVMRKVEPGVEIRTKNTLTEKDEELAVSLKFNSISDFEPAQIVNQVPALKELKTARDQLRDLLSKTDRSDKLEKLLESVLNDNEKIQALAKELGLNTATKNSA
jgi:type VI secretion system protein ImpB